MAKNVLIISASPRIGGNSDILCDELAKGAVKAGNSVTKFNLQNLKIKPCIGCERCHTKSGGYCIHKDDMEQIFEAMAKSDVLVLASPVYFYDVCSQMKAFLDRTYSKFYTQMSVFNFTESVFISSCEAGSGLFKIPLELYRSYISTFGKVKSRGEILAPGIHIKGEVSVAKKREAYEMGENL